MKNALRFLLVCLLAHEIFGQQHASSGQPALVFTHVTVIDATGAPPKRDMTVVVRGDRIEALGKTANLNLPENVQVVDAAGKFLIPGLWDMHVHFWRKGYLVLFIANGVTGVRVMNGEPMHHKWREEISEGRLIGPRMVITTRFVDGPNYNGDPIVSNEDEGRQLVRKVKKEGTDSVKVGNSLPRGAYFAIADEAKKQGVSLVGHVPFSVSLAEASDAGLQSIEHCHCILLACSREGDEERRRKDKEAHTLMNELEAMRALYKQMAGTTYSEKEAAALFARLVKNSTWVCPTLIVFNDLLASSEQDSANDPRFKYIPLSTRDGRKNNVYYVAAATGEGRANLKKAYAKQLAIVGAMRDAGVGLLAGTDGYTPGLDLHGELALFVQAGLSPLEALRTATYNPAKFLGKLDSMGTIEQGKIADLVLLDANPLQDIRNTKRIAAVVVGGKIFDKTALQKMLAQSETSPLIVAAAEGKTEHVKSLISGGVDVNVKDLDCLTPLHYAVQRGHKETVEVLLEHGADVNIGDYYSRTAAEYAMSSNHGEIVQLLVSKGADISPLHFALYMKDEAKARSLIEGGADVNRRTPYGTTPLDRAVGAGFKDIVGLLIAKGANVNTKDNWDWTPLHSAVYGHKDIVELLIAKGADVNARDAEGRTPLSYAGEEGHTEIVELLRKHEAKE